MDMLISFFGDYVPQRITLILQLVEISLNPFDFNSRGFKSSACPMQFTHAASNLLRQVINRLLR